LGWNITKMESNRKKERSCTEKKTKMSVIQWNLQNKVSINLFKSAVTHIVRVDAKVTKDSEVQAGNKHSRCNSCDEKKEIVFEKEGFRLCNECLDEFMKQHRFTK